MNLYLHPASARSPAAVRAVERATGRVAMRQGRKVVLMKPGKRYRPGQ